MKLIILLVTLCAFASASRELKSTKGIIGFLMKSVKTTRAYEEQFNVLIEKFRKIMGQGSDVLQLPVLDPIEVSLIEVHEVIPELPATIDLVVKDFSTTGLVGFVKHQASITPAELRLDFNFTIPSITTTAAYYKLDMQIVDTNIFGEGTVDVEAINLHFAGYTTIAVREDGYINMNRFDIKFVMERFRSNITGLFGGGELNDIINRLLEEQVPKILEDEGELISQDVEIEVIEYANRFLTKMTLQDLVDFINSGGSA